MERGNLILRTIRRIAGAATLTFLTAATAPGQQVGELRVILDRLARIEEQNRALAEEVRLLRQEIAATRGAQAEAIAAAPESAGGEATLEERVAVQEARMAEQASTKVEASQKFPIRVTGMALFNAWLNKGAGGETEYPAFAAPGARGSGGAGFRQTIIGLEFHGPRTFAGAKVRGEFNMDFFGGSGRILDQSARIRTATLGLDWATRSLTAGLDKPLFSVRDPASLAQVGVSPLTAAGNLWLWIPQVRFEQRVSLGPSVGLRAQIAAVQTREIGTTVRTPGDDYNPDVGAARPGIEGRFELHAGGEERRIEIAPGFHRSVSHIGPASVPSNVFSVDWLIRPLAGFDFSGIFFTGQNVAHLGTGGIRQGFVISEYGGVRAVHARGGWAQAAWQPLGRLTLRGFGGIHDDRNGDLLTGAIGRNLAWGANLEYRLAPNVLAGFEAAQVRTSYLGASTARNNHYDLALAYLF